MLATNSAVQVLTGGGEEIYFGDGRALLASMGGTLVNLLLAMLNGALIVLASAAIVQFLADQHLGHPVGGVLDAYRSLKPKWKTLVVALLLVGLINVGFLVWMMVPCIGWLSGPGVYFFFVAVVQPLIAPIVTLENQSAGGSLRRAWDLARQRFWPLIGFIGLLYLLNQVFTTGPVILVSAGVMFSAEFFTSMDAVTLGILQQVILSTIGVLAGLIFVPLQAAAIYTMYIDLRVRTEGFDLAWKAEKLEEPTGVLTRWPAAPAPDRGTLVTNTDVGNLVLLTVGFVVLIGLLYGGLFAILGVAGLATGF